MGHVEMSASSRSEQHWADVWSERDPRDVSWHQDEPTLSLEMICNIGRDPEPGLRRDAAVIDVGGGASLLVDRLLAKGFADLTVLDISATALAVARERVGPRREVTWLTADLLSWEPTRRYDIWHDRAVFHFLAGAEVRSYRDLLDRALAPGGAAVIGTFGPDGPERCSGLDVTRYDAEALADVLGPHYAMVQQRREVHTTPGGASQMFTWIAARQVSPSGTSAG